MPHVEILMPDQAPRSVALGPKPLTIGRAQDCDIRIDSQYISSRHTVISLRAFIKDLGSRNGTWVGDERVDELGLTDGDAFHFGWKDKVQLKVVFDANSAKSVESDSRPSTHLLGSVVEAELRAEVDRYKRRIAELEALHGDLQKEMLESTGSEVLFRPVKEPPPTLIQSAVEPRASASPSAAAKATPTPDPSADLRRELAEMRAQLTVAQDRIEAQTRRIVELEAERAASSSAGAAAQSKKPATEGAGPSRASAAESPHVNVGAADLIQVFVQRSGLEISSAAIETMRQRPGILSDVGYMLALLADFSRGVEGVVSEKALSFLGSSKDHEGGVTMLPGWQGNIRQSIQRLLMQGGDAQRVSFERYLEKLRLWVHGYFGATELGAKKWYREYLNRVGPDVIQREKKPTAWRTFWNLSYRDFWETYVRRMEDLTSDVAMDELSQHIAAAGRDLGEAKGNQ
ncbi:MAG: FHA domain-containing protein [Planctomycetota bacterium]